MQRHVPLQAARQAALHSSSGQGHRHGSTELPWSTEPRQNARSSVLPQSSLLLPNSLHR
jgi:hypothetical protein